MTWTSSKSIFDRTVWLPIAGCAAVLTAILLVPYPLQDVLLLAAIGAAVVLAFFDFPAVWVVFIALVPLARVNGGLFHLTPFWITRILIVLLLAVYLLKHRETGALRRLFHSNGFRFFALFILANGIAALYVRRLDSLLVAFTYFEPLLFFALCYLLVYRNTENSRRILQAILIGGFLVAALGLIEMATQQSVAAVLNPALKDAQEVYFRGWESNRFGLGGRINSLIGIPPFASLYFVIILVVAIYYVHTYQRSRREIAVFSVFGLVCVLLTFATGTRAGLLALLTALLVFGILGPKRPGQRLWVIGGLAAAVVLLFFALPPFHAYILSSLDFANDTPASRNITGRWALTMELLRIFREHWFLGYGPGLVQKQGATGELPTVPGIKSLGGIENQYATLLADGGIVVGLAYLAFMGGVLWQILAMLRQTRWRAMGLTLLAAFGAYFVFAATETTLTAIPYMLLVCMFGAFAAEFENAA